GTPADWQFTFSPSSLSLNFGSGATSVPVQVVIVSPTNALVSHPSLRIVATSTTDASTAGDVTVNVDITRVRGLSVGLDSTTAAFDGRFLNYTLHVKNEGNARETVQVEVTNPNELAAVGWTLSLGGASGPFDGTLLRNVTVDANQTATVRLQAASTSGSSGATVVLVASAQDSPAVSANTVFTLDLPDLAPGTVTVTGPDITRAAPLNTPLVAVATGRGAQPGEPDDRPRDEPDRPRERDGPDEGPDDHPRGPGVGERGRRGGEHERGAVDRRGHADRPQRDLPQRRVDGGGERDGPLPRRRRRGRDPEALEDRSEPGCDRHLQLPPERPDPGDAHGANRGGPRRERRDRSGPGGIGRVATVLQGDPAAQHRLDGPHRDRGLHPRVPGDRGNA